MAGKGSDRTPNDQRSDVINPNNPQHQKQLDDHSQKRNPQDPSNPGGKPQPSNPPGKGKG